MNWDGRDRWQFFKATLECCWQVSCKSNSHWWTWLVNRVAFPWSCKCMSLSNSLNRLKGNRCKPLTTPLWPWYITFKDRNVGNSIEKTNDTVARFHMMKSLRHLLIMNHGPSASFAQWDQLHPSSWQPSPMNSILHVQRTLLFHVWEMGFLSRFFNYLETVPS